MPRKNLILSVAALVVVLGASFLAWSFFSQPKTQTPEYLPLTVTNAPLKSTNEVNVTSEFELNFR